MSKLTDNIKDFHLLHGLKQKELAKLIERAPSTLSNWEKGEASPDGDSIYKLCKVFEVTPNVLFGYEQNADLESFIQGKDAVLNELKELNKQKAVLENRLKAYSKLLSRQ